jgi:hypothetical protein
MLSFLGLMVYNGGMSDPRTIDWNEPVPFIVAQLEDAYLDIARAIMRFYGEAWSLEHAKRPFLWLPNPRTR